MKDIRCPRCGEQMIARFDVVPALALVHGMNAEGNIEWVGESKLDWDGQRAAHHSPRYVCRACWLRISHKRLLKQVQQ